MKNIANGCRSGREDGELPSAAGENRVRRGGSRGHSSTIGPLFPKHNANGIIHSPRLDLILINYRNLNPDKDGLEPIMDLVLEGGVFKEPIDIEDFAYESFTTEITKSD